MTPIEKIVPQIVKALQNNSVSDWPVAADDWLALLVAGIVEREVKLTHLSCIAWGNTYRPTRMVRGKREPNPYYQWGGRESDFIEVVTTTLLAWGNERLEEAANKLDQEYKCPEIGCAERAAQIIRELKE